MWFDNILSVVFAMEICSNEWIPKNTTELRHRLEAELIGQPLVQNIVINSIISHVTARQPTKALVLSLHGTTGTGKTFVSQHIVESLYRKGYLSKFVKFYTSKDFMHDDSEHLLQYEKRLTEDFETTVKHCPNSIFIFDEINMMPKQLFDSILHYLEYYSPSRDRRIDFRRMIVIFISNTGGQLIVDLTAKFDQIGTKREAFPIREFEITLSNSSYNQDGGLWHTPLIEQSLISFFVPFLPLQREHVRQCIEHELQRILDQEDERYRIQREVFVNEVLEYIEFVSSSTEPKFEYARYGCKAVMQKTNTVFEMHRSKLIKLGKKMRRVDDL